MKQTGWYSIKCIKTGFIFTYKLSNRISAAFIVFFFSFLLMYNYFLLKQTISSIALIICSVLIVFGLITMGVRDTVIFDFAQGTITKNIGYVFVIKKEALDLDKSSFCIYKKKVHSALKMFSTKNENLSENQDLEYSYSIYLCYCGEEKYYLGTYGFRDKTALEKYSKNQIKIRYI